MDPSIRTEKEDMRLINPVSVAWPIRTSRSGWNGSADIYIHWRPCICSGVYQLGVWDRFLTYWNPGVHLS